MLGTIAIIIAGLIVIGVVVYAIVKKDPSPPEDWDYRDDI